MAADIPKRKRKPALLISFSGVDGAGKSTQIEHLRAVLQENGYSSCLRAFWDDVVVFSRYREAFVHKAYGSEPGVGAPGKPVQRRDKNVRRWYLTLSRHVLYFLDALHLRRVIAQARRSGDDVLILDRYIYDELANLPLRNPLTRLYIRMVRALVPAPDIAYFLDADPDAAVLRKPEYPVDFMRQCRRAYKQLAVILGGITMVPALPLAQAQQRVLGTFSAHLCHRLAPISDAAPDEASA